MWWLLTFPSILPNSIAARVSSSTDGRTAAHRNHSCANMKGIGLAPMIFVKASTFWANLSLREPLWGLENANVHISCYQVISGLAPGPQWQVPGRFSSRSTHPVDFTAYNLAEVTKHKSFANLDAEGWSVLVVCFKQSSNMFVTNSMFWWVLGGFGGLAMSGYSHAPSASRAIARGRRFTDKNDSLPGSRSLRAIQL